MLSIAFARDLSVVTHSTGEYCNLPLDAIQFERMMLGARFSGSEHLSTPLRRKTPIQIIVVRAHEDELTEEYFDALQIVFHGTSEFHAAHAAGHLYDATDLQIQVLDPPGLLNNTINIDKLLGAADISIVVELVPSVETKHRSAATQALQEGVGQQRYLRVLVPRELEFNQTQQRDAIAPGELEPDLRPMAVALRTLGVAREALQPQSTTDESQPLKFFISHAKLDGMSPASSLAELMRRLSTVQLTPNGDSPYFYDVESIDRGERWKKKLRDAAGNCVFIALRTDQYENRFWCQQEYLYAERAHVPIVVVDLRRGYYYNSARLPFEYAPTVRIFDANLLRIILHAGAAHLRLLRATYMVDSAGAPKENRVVLPRHPSSISLSMAVKRLQAQRSGSDWEGHVFYPPPKLPDYKLDSFKSILGADVNLTSLDDIML